MALSDLTRDINKRTSEYKTFIDNVLQIDRELIEAIEESKKELTSQFYVSGLSPEVAKGVDKIYKYKNCDITNPLTGKEGKLIMK